ncbi:hypothetical protein D3C77_737400 [compost metagenome]
MLAAAFLAFTLKANQHSYAQGCSEVRNVQGFKHDGGIEAQGRAGVLTAWVELQSFPDYSVVAGPSP